MCSTRNRSIATFLSLALLGAMTGCQFASSKPPKMNLNESPMIVYESMQRSDWDRTNINYANGDTLAGPDLVWIESAGPEFLQRVTDPAFSLVNDVSTPVTTVITPPWKVMVYQGLVLPPTYSAQPPPNVIK
jgi:hypothetical protein